MEVTTSDKRVEYEKHRKRSDKISSLLGQYLLKGWRMLEDCCPVCNTILLMNRDGNLYCVGCSEVDSKPSEVSSISPFPNGNAATSDPQPKNKISNSYLPKEPSSLTQKPTQLAEKVSVESDNKLQSVESVINEKILVCSKRLSSTTDLSEIQQLANTIKVLSDALVGVRHCY